MTAVVPTRRFRSSWRVFQYGILILLALRPSYGDGVSTAAPPGGLEPGPRAHDAAATAGTVTPPAQATEFGTGFARKGDFYLGGLFDVHAERNGVCEEINPRGLQWMHAMVYAVELINTKQDILPNVTLGFHLKDTCGNPNVAVKSCLDFITSSSSLGACQNISAEANSGDRMGHLVAVVGPATSNAALSVASLFQLFKLPEISYSATSELLSEARYSYFTRVVPSDGHQATALADIVSHFGWSVVATLATDDVAYGSGGLDLFLQRAKNKSICVAYRNKIGSRSTEEELVQIVKDLRTFPNIKVIVAFANESPMLRLLEVFADQNATGYTWIGTDAWTASPALIADDRIAKVSRGMLGLRYTTREVDGFVEYLRGLSPAVTDYQDPFLIEYWENSFACSIAEGQGGSRLYQNKCSGYEVLPDDDLVFAGEFVSTIFDSVEVIAMALHKALGCDDTHCKKENYNRIDGETILTFMKNVSFVGKSGYRIELTDGGNLQLGATNYDVFNLKPETVCSEETVIEKIGLWSNVEFTIDGNVTWPDEDDCSQGAVPDSICSAPCRPGKRRIAKGLSECCWECVDCLDNHYSDRENALTCSNCSDEEVVNANRTGCVKLPDLYFLPVSPLGLILMTSSIPGIILCIISAAIFIFKRHTQIVFRACAGHSHAILFCSLLCFVSSWLPMLPASDAFCSVKALLQLLSVALLQGILTLTAYVLNRGRQFVANGTRVLIVLCELVTFCVFAGVWFAIDIPYMSRIVDTVGGAVYVDCQDGDVLALALSLAYSVILDAIGIGLAFKGRNQNENFQEGKFTFFSLIVHIMFWAATVALYLVIESGKHFQAFVLAVGVTSTGYVPLVLLFVPKLYLMKTKPYANEKMDVGTKRRIKGRSNKQRKNQKPKPSPEVHTARRALLINYRTTLDAIRGEKTQSIRTIAICSERIEELKSRHLQRMERQRAVLKNILHRKTYLVVSSPHIQATHL